MTVGTGGVPRVRYTPRRLWDTVVRTRTLALFDEWAGRADRAVEIRLFGERLWLLTDPGLCRVALTAPPQLVTRSVRYRRLTAIVGRSLLTTDGVDHRRRRRLIQPAFQGSRVAEYAPAIVQAAADTGRSWRAGEIVAVDAEMASLTLAAIGAAILGIDGRAAAHRLGRPFDRLQRSVALLLIPGADRLFQSRLPGLGRLRRAVLEMQSIAAEATTSTAPLVEGLRQPTEAEEERLADDDLRNELLTLLLAGHETTATTLTWTWWFLDQHPEVAANLRSEHTRILGTRLPAYDDIASLHYTAAVVAETLRLRPAAWIVEREVVGDVDLDGLRPAKGTVLAVSPWLLHRDPKSWSDPESFRPERWLTRDGGYSDEAPGQPRGAWLPFGAGSHVCVGASFAWTEAILVLATLARDWAPTSTIDSLRTRATATLRPARAVTMRLRTATDVRDHDGDVVPAASGLG